MGKVIGIGLMVVCLWIGSEIFSKGAANAFGGILTSIGLAGGPKDDGDSRPVTQRAGDAVRTAQEEADARRERLLAE